MLKTKNPKSKKAPPTFDNQRAYTEQWGLFTCDSGRLCIMKLDDPIAARPSNCECENTHECAGTCCRACWKLGYRNVAPQDSCFASDAEALDFVMEQAAIGSRYHRKAIALAAGLLSNGLPKPPKSGKRN